MKSKSETQMSQSADRSLATVKADSEAAKAEALRQRRAQIAAYI